MKKTYVTALIALFGTFLITSCNLDDKIEDAITECTDTTLCDKTYEACSNGVETWYTYNGQRYDCAGPADCIDAAADVIAAVEADCPQ
ncbi:hypothetical protein [Reichenbachiella ulvae]|uniref:Lipoprotein n=1 Tax=Reichenbachiella ulvae TaxID=2980104 RepID=A0ABT3CXL2_9BACT|nr:hypothetical protein [Reichenbachiella ulvae]MCV9388436.1 hypothetical protein [Reichenbachiella ulvae]